MEHFKRLNSHLSSFTCRRHLIFQRAPNFTYNLWYSFMLSHICFLDFSFYRVYMHISCSVCIRIACSAQCIRQVYCIAVHLTHIVRRSEIYCVFIGLQNSQILIQVSLILFITSSLYSYVVKKNLSFRENSFGCLTESLLHIQRGRNEMGVYNQNKRKF